MFRYGMFSGGRFLAFLLMSSALLTGLSAVALAAEKDNNSLPFDVRIIIDISGSMKQTDPNNLRIPAIKLLLELMPEGAQAGIWTFGRYVNNIVPVAEVDADWRDQAKKAAISISSLGLQTNLSGALNDAAWGLSADSGFQQSIILLTDGKLDMAKAGAADAEQINAQDRKKLMSQVLEKYRVAGANVHTLALSDLADKDLLQEIALETDGLYSEAQDAESLMKAFLRAFDRAIPADQVPMVDNTFVIDDSVNEYTALIFKHSESTQETVILTPSGDRWSELEHPKSVRWHKDIRFDLITIKQPEAGTWIAEANLDPSNRVTILSDLALEVDGIPATIFPGDKLDVEITLMNNGDVLDKKEILSLTDMSITVITASGIEGSKVFSDPESPPVDGVYREGLNRLKELGQYQIDVIAKSRTFQRKRSFATTMIKPVEITHGADEVNGVYRIAVKGLSDNLDVESSRVIAKIKSPDDNTIIQSVAFDEQVQAWVTNIEATKGPGQYRVDLNVRGVTQSGRNFKIKPEVIIFDLPIKSAVAESNMADQTAVDIGAVSEEAVAETLVSAVTVEKDVENLEVTDADQKIKVIEKIEKIEKIEEIAPDVALNAEIANDIQETLTDELQADDNIGPLDDGTAVVEKGLAWWIYLSSILFAISVISACVWWFIFRKSTVVVDAQTSVEEEGVMAEAEVVEDNVAGDFNSSTEVGEESISSAGGPSTAEELDKRNNTDDNFDEDFSIDPDDNVDTDENSWGEFDNVDNDEDIDKDNDENINKDNNEDNDEEDGQNK
jgi:uncharacterized protein (TIGR03503 family)